MRLKVFIRMGRYLVEIEDEDSGLIVILCRSGWWPDGAPPWVFTDREEAQRHAKEWDIGGITGRVVEYLNG